MPLQPAILGTARLGNFRLGYRSAALAAVRAARVQVVLAGVFVNARVRRAGFTVHDAINDEPNTCRFTLDGVRPITGQDVRVSINSDAPRLLFNGTLQTVEETYEGKPTQLAWACAAVDDLVRLNRYRPFGTWTEVSATTIAHSVIAEFAPGFTSTHVAAALPAVSIIFDGSDTFAGALRRLANAIGGYFYVEDLDLHLFLTESTDLPADINTTPGRFLDDPPIRMQSDDSQQRTRVYGKGHGEAVLADLAAGETVLPVADVAMFNPLGGQVIGGTTPDGAQSEILDYTGVQIGGGGSLVGPGAAPSSALIAALAAGSGVTSGSHVLAVVFKTAAGRSLPGPTTTLVVGLVTAPVAAVTAGTPTTGGAVDVGAHTYVPVFRTAAGATTPGPVSNSVTALAEQAAPTTDVIADGWVGYELEIGATYYYKRTYRRSADSAETTGFGTANIFITDQSGGGQVGLRSAPRFATSETPTPPSGFTWVWYRAKNGGTFTECPLDLSGPYYYDHNVDGNLGQTMPSSNSTKKGTVAVTAIPISPDALVTNVDLYRSFNGGTAKYALTVANGVTSASDALANAGRGADVPASNTAVANQISLTAVPIGATSPVAVTEREVYMSPAGGGARKLALTIANNSATTGTITMSDATLAGQAAEPTGDTSGLAQPSGHVLPGSTAILVAGLAPFQAGGGWWFTGTQVGRYTGFTGSSLTGIPASGVGSIQQAMAYNTVIAAAPALVGVTGNTLAMLKGTPVHLWVKRNDTAAQAALIALDAAQGRVSDGVIEHLISDMRRGEASLIALCDADLLRFSRPIVTVTFDARDTKLKSGKPITFSLTSPAIAATLTLMSVDISEIDVSPSGLLPRFHCVASSVAVSLESILRQLLTKVA